MTDDEVTRLTFSQREGKVSLPEPMKLEHVPNRFRQLVWKCIDSAFFEYHEGEEYQGYGYTSNEQGIRHALTHQAAADVGLDEAMFMFGACASFVAYLANKHRQAGRQGPDGQ